MQAAVFRARYRARFLQLADIFLSSGMVPAYTAAAFIKKFARLALTAPPAGWSFALLFLSPLCMLCLLCLILACIGVRQASGWHPMDPLCSQPTVVELGG